MPRTRRYLTHVLAVPHEQHVSRDAFQLADALLERLRVRARVERDAAPHFATTAAEDEEAAYALRAIGADERPVVLHPGSGWPLKNGRRRDGGGWPQPASRIA